MSVRFMSHAVGVRFIALSVKMNPVHSARAPKHSVGGDGEK